MIERLPRGLPVVLLNCAAGDRAPALRIDNAGAAARMVEHLFAMGRRRVVHLSGPAGNAEARDRARGYREAMTRLGGEARVIAGDFSEEAGAVAARALLADLDGVDAVFAANDISAIGLLAALRRAGVDVPGRVAVAGFDDIPLARLVSPSLTTMRVGMAAMGERAVALLADAVAGRGAPDTQWCAPELIARETTGSHD